MDIRMQPGFLGTGASLLADLTLLAYILLILPAMLVGFFFARRKWFAPHHKLTMTGITLFNWVLAGFYMAVSYRGGVAPNVPQNLNQLFYLLPTIHLFTGGIAQSIATYLVLRMWLEKIIPPRLLIRNIKPFMRITLALWFITALLGISIYLTWYSASPAQADLGTPGATPEATDDSPAQTPDAGALPVTTSEADSAPITTPEVEDRAPAATPDAEDDDGFEPVETPETGDDNGGSGNSGSGSSGSG